MAANEDKSMQPLQFDLEDGDVVYLCTWEFVKYKIDELIVPLTNSIANINQSLTSINETLLSWIPNEGEEES